MVVQNLSTETNRCFEDIHTVLNNETDQLNALHIETLMAW